MGVRIPIAAGDPHALVGKTLRGKWHIEGVLGVGGMATVYDARHRNGLRVAIKKLHAIYAEKTETRQRFLNEGYAANKVGHPGAVTVLDDDELDDGTAFIVMEYLDGQGLDVRLKRKQTLDPREVLFIADHVLDVLSAAHARGIVHRDIKPPNLFLVNDATVKVLDFGLVKMRERPKGRFQTRSGMVVGTASYMPPEQARGKSQLIGPRTDLWALGATMFKALTGCYVHEGATVERRLVAAMTEHGRRVADVDASVPRPVQLVVDKAVEFQPKDRFQDAGEMRAAVRDAYRAIANKELPDPSNAGIAAGWAIPADTEGPDSIDWEEEDSGQLHISVQFDTTETKDSVVVAVDGDAGRSLRLELHRDESDLPDTLPDGDEPLSELTVVEVPHAARR